jgi:hypothetical protein
MKKSEIKGLIALDLIHSNLMTYKKSLVKMKIKKNQKLSIHNLMKYKKKVIFLI